MYGVRHPSHPKWFTQQALESDVVDNKSRYVSERIGNAREASCAGTLQISTGSPFDTCCIEHRATSRINNCNRNDKIGLRAVRPSTTTWRHSTYGCWSAFWVLERHAVHLRILGHATGTIRLKVHPLFRLCSGQANLSMTSLWYVSSTATFALLRISSKFFEII